MKKSSLYSLFIVASIILCFLWTNNDYLANFSLQLTAFLAVSLILVRHLHKNESFRISETIISTICVLLITQATGGFKSPFFFLNYFLLFELSLILLPSTAIVLSLSLILFYYYSFAVTSVYDLLTISSFIFMTPVAYICGRLFQKVKNQKKEINNLSEKLKGLEEQIAANPIKPV